MKLDINISSADARALANKAAAAGLTIGGLLEAFVADLVCGQYTNGSDERDLAADWYERCGFHVSAGGTFLAYLGFYDIMEDFLKAQDYADELGQDLADYGPEPSPEDVEDAEATREELEWAQREAREYYNAYAAHTRRPEPWPDALASVKAWRLDPACPYSTNYQNEPSSLD